MHLQIPVQIYIEYNKRIAYTHFITRFRILLRKEKKEQNSTSRKLMHRFFFEESAVEIR